jgi:hypothetical protein
VTLLPFLLYGLLYASGEDFEEVVGGEDVLRLNGYCGGGRGSVFSS